MSAKFPRGGGAGPFLARSLRLLGVGSFGHPGQMFKMNEYESFSNITHIDGTV